MRLGHSINFLELRIEPPRDGKIGLANNNRSHFPYTLWLGQCFRSSADRFQRLVANQTLAILRRFREPPNFQRSFGIPFGRRGGIHLRPVSLTPRKHSGGRVQSSGWLRIVREMSRNRGLPFLDSSWFFAPIFRPRSRGAAGCGVATRSVGTR